MMTVAASRHQLGVGCSFSGSERQEGVAMHLCFIASMALDEGEQFSSHRVHSALLVSEDEVCIWSSFGVLIFVPSVAIQV